MGLGAGLSESLPEGATPRLGGGGGKGELFVRGRGVREGRKETHVLLLLCRGRREGWRNNLDGLCLMEKRERERQRQTKTQHTW